MGGAARYAIYFAPPPASRWWRFGCQWLGRDPIFGRALEQCELPNVPPAVLCDVTAAPRRYGFHATLKAPFSLGHGVSDEDVYRFAAALARMQRPFELGALTLRRLGGFLAAVPEQEPGELSALAGACVTCFDALRAPADEAELARRRKAGLTPRQEALLARWGYPYVMDQWRFHMTLTGDLSATQIADLEPPLLARVRQLNAEALVVDAICVFEEPEPGTAFRLTRRFGFDGVVSVYGNGAACGRLLYVVGASGAGKDSLLAYARERLSGGTVAFAHRYITRAQDAGGENHVALSDREFEARARHGAFAMYWTSNGHRYGIGAEVDHWLSNGRDVVVNGSREYLDAARARYPGMIVVWVRASPGTLNARLAARGREDAGAIQARLARAERYAPPAGALVIDNDGALEEAGERLVRVLSAAAAAATHELEPAS